MLCNAPALLPRLNVAFPRYCMLLHAIGAIRGWQARAWPA
jgi:hypothetical protein